MPHLSRAHLDLLSSCTYKHIRSLSTDGKQLATLLACGLWSWLLLRKSYNLLAAEIEIVVSD